MSEKLDILNTFSSNLFGINIDSMLDNHLKNYDNDHKPDNLDDPNTINGEFEVVSNEE